MRGSLLKLPGGVGEISVPVVALDDYIREKNHSGRFLMKIDVEGHECELLRGAAETLKLRKPEMILEATGDYDAETLGLLREHGYRIYTITNTGLQETETLTLDRSREYFFLNNLVTTRPSAEVKELFEKIRDRVESIDIKQTSLYHDVCKRREAEKAREK